MDQALSAHAWAIMAWRPVPCAGATSQRGAVKIAWVFGYLGTSTRSGASSFVNDTLLVQIFSTLQQAPFCVLSLLNKQIRHQDLQSVDSTRLWWNLEILSEFNLVSSLLFSEPLWRIPSYWGPKRSRFGRLNGPWGCTLVTMSDKLLQLFQCKADPKAAVLLHLWRFKVQKA